MQLTAIRRFISCRNQAKTILLAMKLTVVLLLSAFLASGATGYSQKVTLSLKNAPLEKVFREIQKQTNLDFLFTRQMLKETHPVDVEVKDASLQEVMNICLKDQPLDFVIDNNAIVIKEKSRASVLSIAPESTPPLVDIDGRVTDSTGAPLVGASVTVRGSRKGTVTDAKGEFGLKGVDSKATLTISFTGYVAREFNVHGQQEMRVILTRSTNPLDEVQVIGYGTVSKRFQTGNVSTVKAEEIDKQPVSNPLLALEGRVPGLYVTQANGLPGSAVKVLIQGKNSMLLGNDPLYVIDGVPYVSQNLATTIGTQLGAASGGFGYGNPMSYINPGDIESIEILKDADATAIYGSRAANGAILITTKRGKSGKSAIDLSIQNGWGSVAHELPLLNTQQYLQMRHEALRNDGQNPYPSLIANPNDYNYEINGVWDTTRYTDWQQVLLGGTAQYTTISGSVSGGNSSTQYLVGGTYHRETSVFPGNYSDNKGSVHFSLATTSSNQRLRLQLSALYLQDNNALPTVDQTATALMLPPNAPKVFNADGTLNWQLLPNGSQTWFNPFAGILNNRYQSKTYNLIGNAIVSYQILRGLVIKSNLGYTNMQTNEIISALSGLATPANQILFGSNIRSATYSNNLIRSWIAEPQLEYKAALGEGKIEAVLGTTFLQNNSSGYTLSGQGYNSDALVEDVHSAATLSVGSSVYSQYNYNAVFGRVNVSWNDKYIMDFVGRRDGSSRFGQANQFHNFGSVGAAWIFTQEGFFRSHVRTLSFGKIRVSYGSTGNDQLRDYGFMNLYTTVRTPVAYQNVTGLAVINLPNPYLQWEETRKLQFGVDLAFFQNRVSITANYAINRSSNELQAVTLPYITGFASVLLNVPLTVENKVSEFVLNTINVKTKNFGWNTTLNFTIPKNTILSYHGRLPIGSVLSSLGYLQVFHFLGVDPATGRYSFQDSHGNPTSNPVPGIDYTTVNANLPISYGGIENSFRYKQFQLDFLFQYVNQIASNYFGQNPPGTVFNNQPVEVLNRWKNPGDLTSTQRFSTQSFTLWSNFTQSDAAYSKDASFLRLKNLSLSYSLSENVMHKIHIRSMRIFAQGQNLFAITRFKGLDPETGNLVLPPLRVVTIGLQVGF